MCPRCKSTQWLTKSEDPDYWNCMYCGPNPKAGIVRMPFVKGGGVQAGLSREGIEDVAKYSTCADCGVEIEARSKRCKNCAGKGARV